MAKYKLTTFQSLAFTCAMLGRAKIGVVEGSDGYRRGFGWKAGNRDIDRDIRSLLAADVLVLVDAQRGVHGEVTGCTLKRGPRAIDGDWNGEATQDATD